MICDPRCGLFDFGLLNNPFQELLLIDMTSISLHSLFNFFILSSLFSSLWKLFSLLIILILYYYVDHYVFNSQLLLYHFPFIETYYYLVVKISSWFSLWTLTVNILASYWPTVLAILFVSFNLIVLFHTAFSWISISL